MSATELTIGELASMARLTVRALRHYDQIGLLQPARVDPNNGYRYYDTGQIVSASTIAVLRGLDIDVETIGHLLDGSRRLEQVLDAERERRERDARRAASSLAVLASLDPTRESDHAEIVEALPTMFLGTNIRVLASDDIEAAARTFEKLFAEAAAAEIDFDSDGTCIVRQSSSESLSLDICVRTISPDPPPLAGYRRIAVDGGPTATITYHGPLESLPLAHARLNSWILDNDAEPIGHPRETFLGELTDHRTRLEIPIRRLA